MPGVGVNRLRLIHLLIPFYTFRLVYLLAV
nr:MAG TPA: hypothetical protein [Caudoviricetes sp.]